MNRPGGLALPPNGFGFPANPALSSNSITESTNAQHSYPPGPESGNEAFTPETARFNAPAALQNTSEWDALTQEERNGIMPQRLPHFFDAFDPLAPDDPFGSALASDGEALLRYCEENLDGLSQGTSGDFDFDLNFDNDAGEPTGAAGHKVLEETASDADIGAVGFEPWPPALDALKGTADGGRQNPPWPSIDSERVPTVEQQPDSLSPDIDPKLSGFAAANPQRLVSPQGPPKIDGSDVGGYRIEEEASAPSEQAIGQNEDPGKQCEHKTDKADCPRPDRYVAGKFDGRKLCKRHGDQWETKNAGPPIWQPRVISTEAAMAAIRPNIRQPAVYRRPGYHDQSLIDYSDGHAHWTVRFHEAAMTPWKGEGDDHEDPYRLLTHQRTFEVKAANKDHAKEYCEAMIVARMSLLFPIAQRFHLGGPPIYCIGGDNSGYSEDTDLTFLDRLQSMEEILRVNKRVVMDVIEGRGVEAFVRNPRDFDKRKTLNKKGNTTRQERTSRAQPDTTGQSRHPSVEIGEAGPAPQDREPDDSPPAPATNTQARAAPRKRKRAEKAETDGALDEQAQKATPAPRKTRAPRKHPVAQAESSNPPSADHASLHVKSPFGPTIPDVRKFYGPPPDSISHSDLDAQQHVSPQPATQNYTGFGSLPATQGPQPFYPDPTAALESGYQYIPPPNFGRPAAEISHASTPQPQQIHRPHQQPYWPQLPQPYVSQQRLPALSSRPEAEYRAMIHSIDTAFDRYGASSTAPYPNNAIAPTAPGSPAPPNHLMPQAPLEQSGRQSIEALLLGDGDYEKARWIGGKKYNNGADYDGKMQRR